MDDRPERDRSDAAWAQPIASVAAALGTDVTAGLASRTAAERLLDVGPNELDAQAPVPIWRRVGRQFVDPLVGLLLVAIGISTLAWLIDGGDGTPLEAIVIAAIVVANAAIGAWQEERAVRAVAALRRLAGIHATVVRDGRTQVVARTELVPGDVLVLAQGDAVGADCRLIETASLVVAEAALTGESAPVSKSVDVVAVDAVLADRTNMAYQGTAVTSGRGIGVVVATGMRSELGRVVASLIDTAESEPTPLEVQIDWLGKALGLVVLVLAAIVVATILVTSDVSSFSGYVDATLVGVSLSVAAVPEGLPAILTIVLALGVQRMAAQQAIVKQLSSVETLGAASVICTDKTGTLTRNEMSVVTVVVASGRAQLTGVGYVPIGHLVGDGGEEVPPEVRDEVSAVLRAGSVANDASLHVTADGSWQVRGDPTEIVFLVAEQKLAIGPDRPPDRVGEIPFDADRKLMSTVNDAAAGGFVDVASPLVMFTKGAPDVLVDRCVAERMSGAVHALTDTRRRDIGAAVDALADEGLRPLAVAYRPVDSHEETPAEHDLILLGIVGIADPPRAEALAAVREAQAGGIRVVMITGDHPRTATTIAGKLGIGGGTGSVVTGLELEAMTADELSGIVTEVDVYARVDPAHKLRIVRSLQRHGHVTAMTGDGVNDAPALKQADIGVAMGINGTEVSKEAADMILADDDFATILKAVREGREIFSDIGKFLRYLLASNTGEVMVVFLGVLFASTLGLDGGAEGLAVPLLATQILWINLVTDGALALALGVDPAVEDVMARPPRAVGDRLVDRAMMRTIVVIGGATALVGLVALDLRLAGGLLGGSGDLDTARTMAFTTVVLAQVVNAFCARSDTVSVVVGLFDNRLLWLAAAVTVVSQVAVVHVPFLSSAFATEPLSWREWGVCSLLAFGVLGPAEASKWWGRRRLLRR